MMHKQHRKLETDLADSMEDKVQLGRQVKKLDQDLEHARQKYQQAKSEAQTAFKGLENYQTILTKFEESIRDAHEEKDKALADKEAALQEMSVVR